MTGEHYMKFKFSFHEFKKFYWNAAMLVPSGVVCSPVPGQRADSLQQALYGLQSLKYLLVGSSQENVATHALSLLE